jgi:hypothetical protein
MFVTHALVSGHPRRTCRARAGHADRHARIDPARGVRPGTLAVLLATWRSGYAAACKAVYTGSIPVVAFRTSRLRSQFGGLRGRLAIGGARCRAGASTRRPRCARNPRHPETAKPPRNDPPQTLVRLMRFVATRRSMGRHQYDESACRQVYAGGKSGGHLTLRSGGLPTSS